MCNYQEMLRRHNSCVDFTFMQDGAAVNSHKLTRLNALFERVANRTSGGVREDKLRSILPEGIFAKFEEQKNNETGLRIFSRGQFLAMFAYTSDVFLNSMLLNERRERERLSRNSRNSHVKVVSFSSDVRLRERAQTASPYVMRERAQTSPHVDTSCSYNGSNSSQSSIMKNASEERRKRRDERKREKYLQRKEKFEQRKRELEFEQRRNERERRRKEFEKRVREEQKRIELELRREERRKREEKKRLQKKRKEQIGLKKMTSSDTCKSFASSSETAPFSDSSFEFSDVTSTFTHHPPFPFEVFFSCLEEDNYSYSSSEDEDDELEMGQEVCFFHKFSDLFKKFFHTEPSLLLFEPESSFSTHSPNYIYPLVPETVFTNANHKKARDIR